MDNTVDEGATQSCLADDGRRSSSTRHAQKASPARAALASPCMTRNTAARCRVMLDTRAAVKSKHGVPALARAPSLHMLAAAGAPADCAALPGTTFLMQPAKCAHAGLRVAPFRALRTR